MKKVFSSIFFVALVFGMLASSSYAANCVNYFGGFLVGGVGSSGAKTQYYFVDSTASAQTSLISSAMTSWNATATPIYFKQTTNKSSSVMDFYYGTYFSDNTVAITNFFTSGMGVDPSAPYTWTKILINKPQYNTLGNYDKQGTLAHEMGHAFGLAHDNGETDSIMCQLQYDRYVNKPDSASIKGINVLY